MEEASKQENPEEPKKISTTWILIGTAVLILLVFGVIFAIKYFYKPIPYETVEYNNFVFTKMDNSWYTQWQLANQTYNVGLRYNPFEVENVTIEGRGLNQTFSQKKVYYTFDPLANESEFKYLALTATELGFSFVGAFNKEFIGSCLVNETDGCSDRPVVDCSDTDKAVIKLIGHGDTKIVLDGNCLILQGEGLELIRAADRALYQFYKIMK